VILSLSTASPSLLAALLFKGDLVTSALSVTPCPTLSEALIYRWFSCGCTVCQSLSFPVGSSSFQRWLCHSSTVHQSWSIHVGSSSFQRWFSHISTVRHSLSNTVGSSFS
jgi:hypothetical protein